MTQSRFNYEIVERIAVLSQWGDTSKELNKVSYNGAEPKYDLRSWKRTSNGETLLKGLTLNDEEMEALKEAVSGVYLGNRKCLRRNIRRRYICIAVCSECQDAAENIFRKIFMIRNLSKTI